MTMSMPIWDVLQRSSIPPVKLTLLPVRSVPIFSIQNTIYFISQFSFRQVQLFTLRVHDTIYWLTFYDWVCMCVCVCVQKFKQISFCVSVYVSFNISIPHAIAIMATSNIHAHTHARIGAYSPWTPIQTTITKLYQNFFSRFLHAPICCMSLFSIILTLCFFRFFVLLACSSRVV